jgi:phosphoribosylformylglycinamidine synthase PurS subunit
MPKVYNRDLMKAHVYVTLKRSVLDAQGQTVAGALRRMNYVGVADVRQGKYFQLTLEDSLAADAAGARAEVDRIAREVLTNPVIEEYTYTLEA